MNLQVHLYTIKIHVLCKCLHVNGYNVCFFSFALVEHIKNILILSRVLIKLAIKRSII